MYRNNNVQQHIRDSVSCREILENTKIIDKRAITAIFRHLPVVNDITEEDIQHPKFQLLLNKMNAMIPWMNAYELSVIVIGIMNHKTLIHHQINGKVCDAILTNIQDIPFKRMLQLVFIMRKTKSTNSFEKIQRPINNLILNEIMQRFSGQNIYIQDFPSIASYMSDNHEMFQLDFLQQFSSALLVIDERQLTGCHIASIIKIFSRFNELDEQSRLALKKMVELWISNRPTSKEVDVLFSLISGSRKFDKLAFEESGLIEFIFDFLDGNNDKEAFPCYGHLIKMTYWRESIDLFSKLFIDGPFDLDMRAFVQICCACERYDYKPSNWETSIFPVLQSFDFHSHIDEVENFSWPGFALKLHLLGHSDTQLIEAVLHSTQFKDSIYNNCLKEILKNHDSNDIHKDFANLLRLQILIKNLEKVFGLENILIDHRVNEQCNIPFVLLVNLETKEFLPIAWNWLDMRPNEQLIGMIVAEEGEEEGELETIETDENRIKFIKLKPSSWIGLPESERKTFLFDKINDVINSNE